MRTVGWMVRPSPESTSSPISSGLNTTPSPSTRVNPFRTLCSSSRPAAVEWSMMLRRRRWASSAKACASSEK